ncbi:MAG TPA: FAD-containing oxidoreductase [Aestuariivirgaceae bacterium]|nr:FAD-containing oxidoreductase [Aestuariivirgaceae bacterium]
MPVEFDAIIIGAGQAGPSLAARFSKEGQRVAIIERKHFGGTCVNTGCIPTKTLVASAYVAHMARRAQDYGVDNRAVSVDMKRVKARKDAIVEQSRDGLSQLLGNLDKVTIYKGHARFTAPRTVEVKGELLSADRIFVNSGGRAAVPKMPGLDAVPFLTNSTMMEVDFLPDHLLIVGGSYVGLEFAHVYRRFGARVTVVEMADRLIVREDPDISDAVREILEADGVEVRLKAECLAVEKDGDRIAMNLECAAGAPRIHGSHVLLAVGRRPNTEDLGLDKAGVQVDAKGFITVDDQCRTNVDGIWALGEVNGRGAFTHTSYNDFEIVAANLFDNDPRRISDRITCYGLFIDPPLGRVGMTEQEVRQKGLKALYAKKMMTSVGRARERGETKGFMKVVVDAESRRILGAAVLGVNGDEVVHAILDVMAAGLPYTAISRTMHIHPTVAEYLPTLLGELQPIGSLPAI